jgi:phosphatidylserine/phosphatidylglycerophosphate/cardiolipin synthase-like enzyme
VARPKATQLALIGLLLAVASRTLGGGGHVGSRPELPAVAPPGAARDRLIVEPDDGMPAIYELLRSARRSLDLTMYELADPTAEAVLAEDAARGVRVRVLLDGRLERVHNLPAFDYLRGRGVAVAWASRRYFVTHEKAFVIDGDTAVVMSLNLAAAYYATSRDAAVVDPDPRDAAAIEAVFAADFAGRSTTEPAADDLVWSPDQSQADLLAMIDAARRSLSLESEELSSPAVVDGLLAAARRGVAVTVAMTYRDSWRPAFGRLSSVGARIAVMYGERPRYLHAKLMVVDAGTPRARAFVGSENLSDASLLHDRELGIVLVAPGLVEQVRRILDTDVSDALSWRA